MKSNIRKLRNERNITQTALGEVLGKTQQTISHMENDRDRIPIESLITMANYFGVSTDCVLGLEEENDSQKTQSIKESNQKVKGEELKEDAGKNKKILYQLILTLLLDSIDDDAQSVIGVLGSHV